MDADEAARRRRRRLLAALLLLAALVGVAWWLTVHDAVPYVDAPAAVDGPTHSAASANEDGTSAVAPRKETRRARTADEPATEADPTPKRADFYLPHRVRVTVVSAVDGSPVAGALVVVDSPWIRDFDLAAGIAVATGADGVAVLKVNPGNGLSVTARKPGFVIGRAAVAKAKPDEARIELKPGFELRGRVVFAESREPAAGVLIRAWRGSEEDPNDDAQIDIERSTDADGRFDLPGVPLSTPVRVFAVKPGYRTVDVLVQRDAAGADIELVLGEGGVLEGVVYDVNGVPMPDVDCFLIAPGFDPPDPSWTGPDEQTAWRVQVGFAFPPTKTDAAGRYEWKGVRLPIDGAPQPRVVVARDAKGRTAKSEPATFTRHGERQTRDVRFKPAASITVRVAWKTPPQRGYTLRLHRDRRAARPEAERALASDASGATFDDLAAGTYVVSLEADEGQYVVFTRQVDVAEGERAETAFAPDGDRRIEGVVVDEAGAPIDRVTLGFETIDQERGFFVTTATTRADGAFAFDRLAPVAGTVSIDGTARVSDETPYEDVRVHDVVPGGPALRLVLRRGARIVGRFVPPPGEKGRIRLGAAIDDAYQAVEQFTVSDDGRFVGTLKSVGRRVDLFLSLSGFARDFAPVLFPDRVVAPGGTLDLGDVKLDAGLTFVGKLRDADGKAVSNTGAYAIDPWLERPVKVDADGTFRLEHLPRRPVHLSVSGGTNGPPWHLTIDPATLTGTFTIGDGVAVLGRALDAAGAPARNVRLRFRPRDARTVEAGTVYFTTDADGRFEARVAPARFHVEVERRDDYVSAVTPAVVEFADGENAPLELRLR